MIKKIVKYFIYFFKVNHKFIFYSIGIKFSISSIKLMQQLQFFLPKKMNSNLIRVGNKGDGGYLLPDILTDEFFCISVGSDKEWSFEKDLFDKYHIKSLIIDEKKKQPDDLYKQILYIPKFLGLKDSKRFISFNGILRLLKINSIYPKKMILKLDIEGDEYAVLPTLDHKFLNNVLIIIIEFHNLDLLQYRKFFNYFKGLIVPKIFLDYTAVHLHPNNCCGFWSFKQIKFPKVAELTLIRKDLFNINTELATIPNLLDYKNVSSLEDIFIDPEFIKLLNQDIFRPSKKFH